MNSEGLGRAVPFAPLKLSTAEQQQCQELTLQLLDNTLRSYDERRTNRMQSPRHHADLDSSRWKRQKTRADVSLYSERDHEARLDLHLPGDSWEKPSVLLAAGTMRAQLDDVMLGLATPDFGAMKLRAIATARQDVKGAMLAKLSGPVESEPFQNLSVIWMVGQPNWPLSMMVHPRDFIMLAATGVIFRADGERIGYDVVQPAPLDQHCPALDKSVTRGKVMYGALYKENYDGTVDVYIQLYVETYGHVLDAVVMNATWTAVLGFWEAPRIAELKKLEYCIAKARKDVSGKWERMENRVKAGELRCDGCCEQVTRRGSLDKKQEPHCSNICVLCGAIQCRACRIKRSLHVLVGRGENTQLRNKRVIL